MREEERGGDKGEGADAAPQAEENEREAGRSSKVGNRGSKVGNSAQFTALHLLASCYQRELTVLANLMVTLL